MKRVLATATAVFALAAAGAASAQPAGPVVRTASGPVQGVAAGGIESYKGLPFAAPPTGELRWKPPAAPAAWTAVRSAAAFGPPCSQPERGFASAGRPSSEDCLSLNVFTPSRRGKAPVMVWIHGGSWTAGSGGAPYYDGTAFARDGVVLVSINYRLGALGYFAHPALTKAAGAAEPLANYGQMDQIAALRWVQQNIAAFGGDPAQVTVFGESAGGGSVLALLATPSARGLFSKAIVESGPAFGPPRTLASEERAGLALAAKTGLGPDATAAQLRAVPAMTLIANQGGAGPVIDGRLQPVPVELAFFTGQAMDVPLMIGTNADEGSLTLIEGLKGMGPMMLAQLKPEERTQLQAAYGEEAADPTLLGRIFFSDMLFGAPARWIAERESSGAPAYLYRFSYVSPALKAQAPRGAQHAGELGYVFETVGRGRFPATPQDVAEAKLVHSCWIAFAKTGAPACNGGPAWPAYTPANDTLMHFADDGGRLETHFRKPQFDLIQQVVTGRVAAAMAGGARPGQ